jgi:hypothetical protein
MDPHSIWIASLFRNASRDFLQFHFSRNVLRQLMFRFNQPTPVYISDDDDDDYPTEARDQLCEDEIHDLLCFLLNRAHDPKDCECPICYEYIECHMCDNGHAIGCYDCSPKLYKDKELTCPICRKIYN